jgi:flagellar protein FlgJ
MDKTNFSIQGLAIDANSLHALKRGTSQNDPEAIRETAKQFEALLIGMMLKTMRKSLPQGGMFDNEQSKMFTTMFDEQISQKVAERGLGLADILEKQLMSNAGLAYHSPHSKPVADPLSHATTSITQSTKNLQTALPNLNSAQAQVQAFQEKLSGCAETASQITGIPANFMLGQAALETGWGKHEIVAANGQSSHNVFGIKAGKNWTGKTVDAMTTEYVDGVATKKLDKFRVYDNYQQAFNDYAKLLQSNQRYKNVIASAKDVYGFVQGLQNAGYATDPSYADKLMNVITKNISA